MSNSTSKLNYRLLIREDLWKRAFAEFATGRRLMAWGPIQRSYHGPFCDLIVRKMSYTTALPKGVEHSPLYDWIVFDAPVELPESEILRKISDSELRLGQLMVYLQPGLGTDHSRWVGAVVENQSIHPLQSICIVGSGMKIIRRPPRVKRFSTPKQAKTKQPDQWSRLVGSLGHQVFRRFRNTEILLIGGGRIGSLMASTLVRNGVRAITIVDSDVLEPHNRDATFGNVPSDVGKSKVDVLVKHLHQVRPTARITGITKSVQDESIVDRFRQCAVVITCVDNDTCRRYVARLSAQLLKIHIDVGTIVREPNSIEGNIAAANEADREIAADVRLMLPGACLSCVGGLEAATTDEVSWNAGGRVGSLTSINHIAVGVAQQIYFDFLAEKITSSFWQRIEWVQGQGLRVAGSAVVGDPKCPICNP